MAWIPLLWLWYRPAAVAPVQRLAWELPYTVGYVPKKAKKKKKYIYIYIETDIVFKELYSLVEERGNTTKYSNTR